MTQYVIQTIQSITNYSIGDIHGRNFSKNDNQLHSQQLPQQLNALGNGRIDDDEYEYELILLLCAILRIRVTDDHEEEDEENQPNFLQARAQKAAHFAKREVEMQRVKKERDKRKAELVAESGGLKYTAIAMANMQS